MEGITFDGSESLTENRAGSQRVKQSWVRRVWGVLAPFSRFVVVGGSTTALFNVMYAVLVLYLPIPVTTAIAAVTTTLLANELHSRWTFRSGPSGLIRHVQAGATAFASWLVTTGAVMALYELDPQPSFLVEQIVLVVAMAAAGIGRYLVLSWYVYRRRPTATNPTFRCAEK